jgi:monoamine oxidase
MLDIAVVGGGVGGVYSAWRLLHCNPARNPVLQSMVHGQDSGQLNIALFEMSHRIGGRLLSAIPPGMPHVPCELGGMRYIPQSQKLVASLAEVKLGLPYRTFFVSEPENLAYLRGKHLHTRDLGDPDHIPYDLAWDERDWIKRLPPEKKLNTLLGYAVNQIIPGVTSMPPAALRKRLETFHFNGTPLYQHGFWNLVARTISHEAYEFALRTSGYDTIGLNWNAVDTIVLNFGDFGDVTYRILTDGYEALPRKLFTQFIQAGGRDCRGYELRRFDRTMLPDGSDGVAMTFYNHNDSRSETWHARALILGMPRRSLELIEPTGAVLGDPQVRENLAAVTPIPLFKLFICYPYPWWEASGITRGRSVTDLPLRQCYYWGVEGEQPGADPHNRNAVMLATYDDTLNVRFWAGLKDPRAPHFTARRLPPEARGDHGDVNWQAHTAPQAMVEEAHRQLQNMHGLRYLPSPYAAAFMDWSGNPYGGGVNFWKMHYKSWEIIPQMIKPRHDAPVYICGEAYSNGQGWVEGALETAEMVLKHLGVDLPEWVRDYQPSGSSSVAP